jgi:isoleucyl-tRNA synthetase
MARFQPVDPKVDFPTLERRVLEGWKERDVFARSLQQREGAPEWIFYEGPPTANGKPGIHHVESRTFKDVYPRYRTMTGHRVARKAGWDCHGLPVELEVEKKIGTTSKRDIEAFGIAEFNRLCRESVKEYVDVWERMTERVGFWVDLSDAYWTMDTEYVESVWWSLKKLHEDGLLFEDHKSIAYCPRCGTGLSDHEVALGYTQVVDPSVFVAFPVTEPSDEAVEGAAFLGWTTTPWTLLSNFGLAVAEDEPYVIVARADGRRWVVGEPLREKAFGEEGEVVATVRGSDLVGSRYSPPFENVVGDPNTHRVVAADFVAMNEGTGIVHVAPGFGEDDLVLGRREGWPVYKPMDDLGRFTDTDPLPAYVRGRAVKEADPDIIEDLRERGLLLRAEDYEHTYPLCWRCDTPLLYVARTSWYVRTTARKERLLEVNEDVHWYPDHIKHGRYGNWLENNVDWALSRERFWGTPLPVWRCTEDASHVTVVGSLRELSDLAGHDVTGVDPHRPAVDEVEVPCRECGAVSRRVPEVIDTWYDSGAMPYAQWGYHPDLDRGVEEVRRAFPADFISEAIDQTRGWFYSLMAEAVLLFDDTAYRNCVVVGHIVDRDGRKMSKRLGNVIDPFTVLDTQGADAIRWLFLTSGSPWSTRRVYPEAVDEVLRQFLLTLWNVYSFFVTYANADGFDPATSAAPDVEQRPALDRWVLSQLSRTVSEVRASMDAYDATSAGRRIQRFVDDLSNWYVRRARRRFWDPTSEAGPSPDKAAAYATLYECLLTVTKLLAPFTPFVTEELWSNLAGDGQPDSVHLADYPVADEDRIDRRLDAAMEAARGIVSLGRTVRTDSKVRTRQPLLEAVVHYAGDEEALGELLPLVAEELNVRRVVFTESAEQLAGWRAKPSFRSLGPRLGQRVKEVAAAFEADDGSMASRLAAGESVEILLDDGGVVVQPDEVDLLQQTREGWGVASEGGLTVALDLELDDELRAEGLAREVIRAVQDARKAAGLEVSDRIELALEADGALASAIEAHRDRIAGETLATSLVSGSVDDAEHEAGADVLGQNLVVRLRLATSG